MRNFTKSLKSAVFSVNFLVCVVVGEFLLISPVYSLLIMNVEGDLRMQWIYYFDLAMRSSCFCIFAPLLASFPYTARFCEEYESGYVRNILTRESPVRYLLTRFIVNGTAGGLALSLPLVIYLVIALFIGKPYRPEDVPEGFATLMENTIFEQSQFLWGGMAILLIFLLLAFLSGAVWANVGLCLSAFVRNKYLAVGFPLVLYYGLTVITVGTEVFGLAPMSLLYPGEFDAVPINVNILAQFIELAILCLAFTIKGKAVLKNV